MVTQSPAFKTATTDSRKLKAKPNNDELLEVNPPRLYTVDHLHLPLRLEHEFVDITFR